MHSDSKGIQGSYVGHAHVQVTFGGSTRRAKELRASNESPHLADKYLQPAPGEGSHMDTTLLNLLSAKYPLPITFYKPYYRYVQPRGTWALNVLIFQNSVNKITT